jgi:DnaK suppressor protein
MIRTTAGAPVRSALVEPSPPSDRAEVDGRAEIAGRAEVDDRADLDGSAEVAGGVEMAQVDVDLALDAIEQELADVELALERLGEGSYGRCETCGQVLSDEELESAPANRFCRAHLPLHLA